MEDGNAKSVTLSWDPSPTPTVIGYEINVFLTESTDSTLLVVDAGNTLTYQIATLADERDHWFCVKAYDREGNQSVCSNVVHSPPVLPDLDFEVDVEILNGNQ